MALSTSNKAIISGVHPNHGIDIEVLDQYEVNNIPAGEKFYKAYDLKIAVLYFQQFPVGTFPYDIICGRPQSKYEANDFNDTVINACAEFCENTKEAIFINSAVDYLQLALKN